MPLLLFGEKMPSYAKSFTSTTAVKEVNLSELSPFDPNSTYEASTFNVEVVGNDAEVSLEVVGPFPNSIEQTPETESTFPIGGKTLVIEGAALGKMVFTRVGTTSYQINITKSY